ncbi:MAG: fumarate hydratase [Clostridia bacterium]|nr:fumarate hydratase [Clostridia bacterium]
MREIEASVIKKTIYDLILKASYEIGDDVYACVANCAECEESPSGREVLKQLKENYDIAKRERVAICQDTGMCVLFIDIGQEVHITGGDFTETVNNAVREAYKEGYLRKSVVNDPLYDRINTKDNTPAVIHTRIVPGDKIDIMVTPKGFGSENMSAIKMLVPADGEKGVIDFVVDTVKKAGPNPCPPIIVGVGIGGTFEIAALMAKRMTARSIDTVNPDPRYQRLEEELLRRINCLGIGPAGIGGRTTALKVNIETYPTHIAGMPVAINIVCHAARHAHAVI